MTDRSRRLRHQERDPRRRGAAPASNPNAPDLIVDVRAAARGDAPALARLVPTLYEDATAYLRARLRDVDAEERADLVSDGVIKVVERLHTVRAVTTPAFFAWAHRVVWRAALDTQRSRARRDAGWRGERLDAGPPGMSADDATHSGPVTSGRTAPDVGEFAPDDTPLQTLARLAAEAQDALPPDAAVVLWAHLVLGASWAEVAGLVATTPGAAKRRFQRALDALRAAVWARADALPPGERGEVLRHLARLDPRASGPVRPGPERRRAGPPGRRGPGRA